MVNNNQRQIDPEFHEIRAASMEGRRLAEGEDLTFAEAYRILGGGGVVCAVSPAESGTSTQGWRFTRLPSDAAQWKFERYNRSENRWLLAEPRGDYQFKRAIIRVGADADWDKIEDAIFGLTDIGAPGKEIVLRALKLTADYIEKKVLAAQAVKAAAAPEEDFTEVKEAQPETHEKPKRVLRGRDGATRNPVAEAIGALAAG